MTFKAQPQPQILGALALVVVVGVALAIAVACLLSMVGCADFERGPHVVSDAAASEASSEAGAEDGGTLSFATSVDALLLSSCRSCHSPGQQAGDTRLLLSGTVADDYGAVVLLVDVTAPTASRLLAKMSGQGHGGGTVYAADSAPYQTILKWIQQGARP